MCCGAGGHPRPAKPRPFIRKQVLRPRSMPAFLDPAAEVHAKIRRGSVFRRDPPFSALEGLAPRERPPSGVGPRKAPDLGTTQRWLIVEVVIVKLGKPQSRIECLRLATTSHIADHMFFKHASKRRLGCHHPGHDRLCAAPRVAVWKWPCRAAMNIYPRHYALYITHYTL